MRNDITGTAPAAVEPEMRHNTVFLDDPNSTWGGRVVRKYRLRGHMDSDSVAPSVVRKMGWRPLPNAHVECQNCKKWSPTHKKYHQNMPHLKNGYIQTQTIEN